MTVRFWHEHGLAVAGILSCVILCALAVWRRWYGVDSGLELGAFPLVTFPGPGPKLGSPAPPVPKRKPKGPGCSRGERECRRVLEERFPGFGFPNSHPVFLRRGAGTGLELDCYNQTLQLAVEYNGRQHYEYNPYFHRHYSDFTDQLRRDEIKERLCAEEKVLLITVPYSIPICQIRHYLLTSLAKRI